jgi:hypothetical protein
MNIPEQLVKIYNEEETWHQTRMTYEDAFDYHKTRYENGDIQVYQENGEVLGYYERYILWDTCILYNLWIREDCRRGKVIRELKRLFFSTLPKTVKKIIGEKQKLGGKMMTAKIRRG